MTRNNKKYEKPMLDEDTGLEWTEKFRELLRETIETHGPIYEDVHGERKGKVDYSFLEESQKEAEPDAGKNKCGLKAEIRKRHVHRMGRIAVVVLSVLVAGSGIGIWINLQPANALKFEMEKKFYEMKGGFSTEIESENASTGDSINIEISDMKDIEKARRVMPNLPVPGYIPEGYELELLKVTIDEMGVANAEYRFRDGDKRLGIGVLTNKKEVAYQVEAEGEIIRDGAKEICIWSDKTTESLGGSFIMGSMEINIVGNLSREEIIEVARNLL